MRFMAPLIAATVVAVMACAPVGDQELIFLEGRAVAPAGDSLLAITGSDISGVLLFDRRGFEPPGFRKAPASGNSSYN